MTQAQAKRENSGKAAAKSPAFHTVFDNYRNNTKRHGFAHIIIAIVVVVFLVAIAFTVYAILVPAPLAQPEILGANCNTNISCVFQIANTGGSAIETTGVASLTSLGSGIPQIAGNCNIVTVQVGSTASVLCNFSVSGAGTVGASASGYVNFKDFHLQADHYQASFNTTLVTA
jgi:hypothetical protein